MVSLTVHAHGAVVTNDGYLPCALVFEVAIIVLLRVHGQIDKYRGLVLFARDSCTGIVLLSTNIIV